MEWRNIMLIDKLEQLEKEIEEADYVLIACGKELEQEIMVHLKEKETQIFAPLVGIDNREQLETLVGTEKENWIYECLVEQYRRTMSIECSYQNLQKLVQKKEYFILSTNIDSFLLSSGLNLESIAIPCGTHTLFQCIENCSNKVWDNTIYLESFIDEISNKSKEKLRELSYPVCPVCGKRAIFNIRREQKNYCETGYLMQWERYKKWLSHTLNRRLLIIELGVDFYLPSIMRWAIEKTVMLNQKAKLVRIHEKLYQVPKELENRSYSISKNAVSFLTEFQINNR